MVGWEKVYRLHDNSDADLDPLPFHVSNVFLHAVVTCLLYLLALRLCVARDSLVFPLTGSVSSGLHRDADAADGGARHAGTGKKRKGSAEGGLRQRRSTANAEYAGSDGGGQRARNGASNKLPLPPDSVGHLLLRVAPKTVTIQSVSPIAQLRRCDYSPARLYIYSQY